MLGVKVELLSICNQRGNKYLLQGLTVCAKCGYAFYGKTVSRATARRKNKDRWAYYRCVGSDAYRFEGGRVCCPVPRIFPTRV